MFKSVTKKILSLAQASLTILMFLGLVLNSSLLNAHADHDKARYVSPDGDDAGKCDNPLSPCKSVS